MIINNNELDSSLLQILADLKQRGFAHYNELFSILYETGIRANELQYIADWTLINETDVLVYTSKNSNDRIVNINLFSQVVQDSIILSNVLFYLPCYEAIVQTFHKVAKFRYSVKNKNITTHLFRHNYIKKLDAESHSLAYIKTQTGIKSDSVVSNYINSQIIQHVKA